MRRTFLAALAGALLLAACSPRLDWREIHSADGGFEILMPGKPQTVTREISFEGRRVPMTIVSTGVGPTLFAAGVAQLPSAAADPPHIDATLAWFRDALVHNIEGRTMRVQPATLPAAAAAGHRVRGGQSVEARGRIGPDHRPGQLAARFLVVDDRLYQLVALGAEGELSAEALDTFFTSFRLVQ